GREVITDLRTIMLDLASARINVALPVDDDLDSTVFAESERIDDAAYISRGAGRNLGRKDRHFWHQMRPQRRHFRNRERSHGRRGDLGGMRSGRWTFGFGNSEFGEEDSRARL